MRIASFNVENLFSRARAMNLDCWAEGKGILAEYARLSARLQKEKYGEADRQAILASIERLGLSRSDENQFVILRQNHGHLLKRPKSRPPEVVAEGRADWIGWLELKTQAINDVAVEMTAKVIHDVDADIIAVVEAENRTSLKHFNDQLLAPLGASYNSVMVFDGNDARGIDVGLMTKEGYAVESLVSHVDDTSDGKPIFSRDCPEYTVRGPGFAKILVLVNHFKSKGYGAADDSDARRKAQAQRVREIYDLRRSQGAEHIAVVGDLNDTPDSDPLSPLLTHGSDLRDVSEHPLFHSDGRLGTYKNGAKSNKIDYLLLSPILFERVTAGGVWRQGVWGGTHGTLFPHYEEMTKEIHAASDHAAIWADIDLEPRSKHAGGRS